MIEPKIPKERGVVVVVVGGLNQISFAKLNNKFPSNIDALHLLKRKKGHKCILKRCMWR